MRRKLLPVTAMVPREIRARLQACAKEESRSLSSLLAVIINAWLSERDNQITEKGESYGS